MSNAGYPKTVQSGVPNLSPCPEGWVCESLENYLEEVCRPLKMADDEEYRLVTVKRARGGVVERERKLGRDILVKSQFYVRSGDFLISKRQIVHGACGLVPEELDGSIVSNEYSVLRGNENIDLNFLAYLSHSIYFQQTCFHSAIGIHVEKMIFKLDKWLRWPFNLPPLPEQRRIADILRTWDQAIETVEALIANSQAQKKALMQELLTGERRLTGFIDPWSNKHLGDICKFKGGSAFPEVYQGDSEGELPFIKVSDMNLPENSIYIDVANNWLNHEFAKKIKVTIFPEGSIVFAKVGAALLLNRRRILRRQTIIDNNMMAAIPNEYTCTDYLYQLMLMIDFAKLVQEGAVPSVNQSDLSKLKIRIPEIKEQKEIARILMIADQLIDQQEQTYKRLQHEKKILMQQLLTGKRRVKVSADTVIEKEVVNA